MFEVNQERYADAIFS